MAVEVVPVRTKQEREQFLRLPWRLYQDDPAWIPNLLLLQREVLDEKKNPFFDEGEAELFLARRDGTTVGRISAQVDRAHNRHSGERTAFFGFFEAVDDAEVAGALLAAAEDWARAHDLDCLRGPFNFSISEEVGVLVEGFEQPPMVATTHALPYYGPLIEGAGYAKAQDLLAYRWQVQAPPQRMIASVEQTRQAPGLKLRKANRLRLNRDVSILLEIYNDAWQDNWGYVPVSRRQAKKLATDLLFIVDPNIALIAEIDGEPAGMIVGLPNLYEVIRDFRGFISPWKLVKLIWRLKMRGPETGRIMLFGVKQKFQRRRDLAGLPFLLLHELYLGSQKGRYKWCEESWILESNRRMTTILPYWGAELYKRYRVYEKQLS